jgi:hypothetical protein
MYLMTRGRKVDRCGGAGGVYVRTFLFRSIVRVKPESDAVVDEEETISGRSRGTVSEEEKRYAENIIKEHSSGGELSGFRDLRVPGHGSGQLKVFVALFRVQQQVMMDITEKRKVLWGGFGKSMRGSLRASEGGAVQEEQFLILAGGAAGGDGHAGGEVGLGRTGVVAPKAGESSARLRASTTRA